MIWFITERGLNCCEFILSHAQNVVTLKPGNSDQPAQHKNHLNERLPRTPNQCFTLQ